MAKPKRKKRARSSHEDTLYHGKRIKTEPKSSPPNAEARRSTRRRTPNKRFLEGELVSELEIFHIKEEKSDRVSIIRRDSASSTATTMSCKSPESSEISPASSTLFKQTSKRGRPLSRKRKFTDSFGGQTIAVKQEPSASDQQVCKIDALPEKPASGCTARKSASGPKKSNTGSEPKNRPNVVIKQTTQLGPGYVKLDKADIIWRKLFDEEQPTAQKPVAARGQRSLGQSRKVTAKRTCSKSVSYLWKQTGSEEPKSVKLADLFTEKQEL